MVVAPPKLEVRSVGVDDFDAIYPLLQSFGNQKMSRGDWRSMLFTYPWWDGPERGFALYADGKAVGFLGTIFSKRRIDGRDEVFCNTSSWIVREEYRHASILLLKPVLAMRDCTILNWTPTDRAYQVFEKLGFRHLESLELLLPPIAHPRGFFGASSTSDPGVLQAELRGNDKALYDALLPCANVCHLLVRVGSRRCYLIATKRTYKRVPFAVVQYASDYDLFWKFRGAAHVGFALTMGVFGLSIDSRFAAGRKVGLSVPWPAKRLYRPARPETPPEAIDGLFSETMMLHL